MDWNNDGKKDLLTGENNGNIRIYLNTNTDADPVFNGYTRVMLGASAYDCGNYSVPWIVDWNNDGMKDVLCGEDQGRVHLLLNVNSDADPQFSTAVYLQDGVSILDGGTRVSPAVADWNRDGKKDLLMGEIYGTILYYENIGTDANPVFNGKVTLKDGIANIDVDNYSRICVADWNNDGVLDILSGARDYDTGDPPGPVYYFEAKGPLAFSDNAISDSTGGMVRFTLNAGTANAGRTYLVLGSASGTEPGYVLPGGMVLPLNPDAFSFFMIGWINTPVFKDFLGTLNTSGVGMALLNVPPHTGYLGETLYFAYTLYNPYDYVSNGGAIEIVP